MEDTNKNKNKIYLVITLIAAVIAAFLCVNFVMNRTKEEPEPTQTATTIKDKEERDRVIISTSSKTIQDGLANMGVLITQEYYFTQVETYTKEKKILIIIPTSAEMMYSYDGAVMAGVDFQKIVIETDESRKAIIIEMPPSEIQTVSIDKSSFKLYSEKDSIWNQLGPEDYNISLADFEEAAKEKAIASGILERSDEQAKQLVREFITCLPNTSGYTIEFK